MKKIIFLVVVSLMIFLIGCKTNEINNNVQNIEENNNDNVEVAEENNDQEIVVADQKSFPDWTQIELENINSDQGYKIADFAGKPILIEIFAVWCPTCTKQQNEIKKLHQEVGEDIISVSLDVDPNEDKSQVKRHAESNGFTWYYSISPGPLTRMLIDEFGNGIINPPQAPVILICEDGSARLLDRGVKDKDELLEEVGKC